VPWSQLKLRQELGPRESIAREALGDRLFEVARIERTGEIKNRTGQCRHRDAVFSGHLTVVKRSGPMHDDPSTLTWIPSDDRHVPRSWLGQVRQGSVQVSGRVMAEEGVGRAGEHGRRVPRVGRHRRPE
jgi:hypothetical protein